MISWISRLLARPILSMTFRRKERPDGKEWSEIEGRTIRARWRSGSFRNSVLTTYQVFANVDEVKVLVFRDDNGKLLVWLGISFQSVLLLSMCIVLYVGGGSNLSTQATWSLAAMVVAPILFGSAYACVFRLFASIEAYVLFKDIVRGKTSHYLISQPDAPPG